VLKNKFDGILFNLEQRDAIAAALDETKKFIAINGPSGSGKMRIAMEIIKKVNNQ
jgi:ABC-type lipoprotein export system ATPase subunit